MGRPFYEYLDGRVYSCKSCRCNLAKADELISRQFHSKHGRAYLFNAATNYVCGDREERLMTTGLHVVCDVYCCKCYGPVGWKYEVAYEKSQKYKEGKVILERACVIDVSEDGTEEDPCESDSDDY